MENLKIRSEIYNDVYAIVGKTNVTFYVDEEVYQINFQDGYSLVFGLIQSMLSQLAKMKYENLKRGV